MIRAFPAHVLAVALGMAQLAAQTAEDAIERFRGLDFRRQAAIVRTVERQLAAHPDPALRRIAALRVEADRLPDAPEHPPIHDPKTWAAAEHAAGRAPERREIATDDPLHVAMRKRFPAVPFLEDLRTEVRYDWQSGRIVRDPAPGYADRFANWMRGFAPGSDDAVAVILARLDSDPRQRELAAWFGHAYCDLQARAFLGITLYEAWFSGEQVEVPDVDAIPFAWEILDRHELRSPLGGPPRDRLYEDIRKAALRHRRYRTTLEAAAAAYVSADPALAAEYERLVPRFHLLWARNGDDPVAIGMILASADRDELIERVDSEVREGDGDAAEIREARRAELFAMAELVRTTALAALEHFAGDD